MVRRSLPVVNPSRCASLQAYDTPFKPACRLSFCRKQRIDYFCADLYPYDSPFAPASSRASIYAPICRIGQTQRQWQKAKRPR